MPLSYIASYRSMGYGFKKEKIVAGIISVSAFSFLSTTFKHVLTIMLPRQVRFFIYKQAKQLISTCNQQYEDFLYKVRIRYLILNTFSLMQLPILQESSFY